MASVADVLADALRYFERSADPMFVVDREREIVARNPAATGITPHGASYDAAVDAVLATGTARTFEWGELGLSGVRCWYSTTLTPVEVEGQIAGAIGAIRDVTELKRSEERLRRSERLMVDTQGTAHLGTWEWDITEPTAVWSDELYRIYGLTRETYTPKYEAYLTMVHPDDRQRVIDATNRVFHEHVPYSHDERIFRPDGSMRYLHTWAHPVLDESGTLRKLVGVCQDITDRMEAEESVRRLNAELEHRVEERTHQLQTALRDLETFNSMVSHDLRGPLAVIQIASDMIARQPDPTETTTTMLGRIRKAIDSMSQLIEDLLAFASAGQSALQPASVDVSALVAELAAEHRSSAPERQVETIIEPRMRVVADPALLRVALSNLVGNAWKYTSRAPTARIEVGTQTRSDHRVLFVRDNGIGFDMKDAARLFQPFTRLDNAAGFHGTGIGLATVARIVERHGGTIRAESAGGGSTFWIALPGSSWG